MENAITPFEAAIRKALGIQEAEENITKRPVDMLVEVNGILMDALKNQGESDECSATQRQPNHGTEPLPPNELDGLSCALCGYFCNNYHHHNNWFKVSEPLLTKSNTGGEQHQDKAGEDVPAWLKCFNPPFFYDHESGYVHDQDGATVLEVRGWSKFSDYANPAEVMDEMGRLFKTLINRFIGELNDERSATQQQPNHGTEPLPPSPPHQGEGELAEAVLKRTTAENKVYLTSNEFHTVKEAMLQFHLAAQGTGSEGGK